MAKNKKAKPFNPEVFLATADGGRTISKYEKEGVVFEQAQPADAVFTLFQRLLSKERRPSSASLERTIFLEKDV